MADPRAHHVSQTASQTTTETTDETSPQPSDGADRVHVCRSTTLPRAQYRFYRALLLAFLERGAPPDRELLDQHARRFGVGLEATLTTLATHDLVQRHPATGAIRAAYPFSEMPTPHRVGLLADSDAPPAVEVYAMCALDALGIPLMLRRRALIASADVLTGEAVRMLVRPAGEGEWAAESGPADWVASWEPSTAVVYACPEREKGAGEGEVAAAYRCPATNFFATAEQWRASHGSSTDMVLAHEDALRQAHARFGGVLDRLEGDEEA
jgi:Alkylmercury lyase